MTISLYAQPYNIDANGFYFSSYEEYTEKQESCRDSFGQPVEEFEIQHIDGAGDFARIVKPDQCNLDEWFEQAEQYEELSDTEQTVFSWLVTRMQMKPLKSAMMFVFLKGHAGSMLSSSLMIAMTWNGKWVTLPVISIMMLLAVILSLAGILLKLARVCGSLIRTISNRAI